MALLCTAAAQSGCATRLDFDHVSAGRHDAGDASAGDASVADASVADASVADTGVARPSVADTSVKTDAAASVPDAAAPGQITPSDAAVLGASPSDASDVPASDVPDDGGIDGGLGPDPGLFSCRSQSPEPYFCDDFETYALTEQWDDVAVYPLKPVLAGSIAIDSSASRAGHDSLLVQINEGVSVCQSCVSARATVNLPELLGPTRLTAEFDLQVEQFDRTPGRRIVLFQVVWGTTEAGFTHHTLQLESTGGGVRAGLVEFDIEPETPGGTDPSPPPAEHGFMPIPALSRWVHVTYTLEVKDLSGVGNTAELTVDDLSVFDDAPTFGLRTADVHMEIGVPWVDMTMFTAQDKSKSWRVRYDNVLVRNEPR